MHNEIRWKSVEFHYHEKNPLWAVFVVIVALFIGTYALWQENLLFLIFTVFAAILTLVWGRRRPRRLEFTINDRGLWIEEKLYPYNHCTGFALHEEMLQMHFKNRIHSSLDIIIPPDKKEHIRDRLLAFLPEVEYTESFIDALAHWLKW